MEFSREREGVDLSKIKLTHHNLKNKGQRNISLSEGEGRKLPPILEVGSGAVQEKYRAQLTEIVAKLNDLFEGELTENDRLVYVSNVIKGKLLESKILAKQAAWYSCVRYR